jgi:hypothetical protein
MPSDDSKLSGIGPATIATWLEELGRHRLIGDVQPCFTRTGAGFRFQVTDEAVHVFGHASEFNASLDKIFPPAPEFDLFISYAAADSAGANELRKDLESNLLKCFKAEKKYSGSNGMARFDPSGIDRVKADSDFAHSAVDQSSLDTVGNRCCMGVR